MEPIQRVDHALRRALSHLSPSSCPAGLRGAMEASVFPAGSRLRPRLVIAIAEACAEPGRLDGALVDSAAVAVELMHCASLVQDDLDCFDAAALRRGRPAVHREHGERLAILASDALIVGAFDVLARSSSDPRRRLALTRLLAERVGARGGITAGQAWESEQEIVLAAYHAAKTGSLFSAATSAGAIAAGACGEAWAHTGALIGSAYQVADDLRDAVSTETELRKPVRVDARLGRPNAAQQFGVAESVKRLESTIGEVIDTLPPCRHRGRLIELIAAEASRFVPAEVSRSAA